MPPHSRRSPVIASQECYDHRYPAIDGRPRRSHLRRHPHRHRQPDRQAVRDPDRGQHDPGDRASQDQDRRRRLRSDDVRPGLHGDGVVSLGDHLHRRRQGHPRVPRLSDRAAGREVQLPRGRLPADPRRAADPGPARGVGSPDHDPHVRARERQGVHAGLPLRRAPDGDAAGVGRRAVDLLSGGGGDQGSGRPLHPGHPAAGQDADAGGVLLSPQPRHALRLSGQRPQLRGQLPVDDLQDRRAQVRARTRGWSMRSTSCSSCTPTTSRTARRARCAASAPPRSTPTRRWRPASPRCTAHCTAAPTRRCCACCGGSRPRRTSRTSSRASRRATSA